MASAIQFSLLLSLSGLVSAQYGGPGGYYGGNNNPYYNGDGDSARNGALAQFLQSKQGIVIAHGVLASAAFVFFFPVGAIIIRLGSFRGVWLVHALFQAFAYILYIAAFAIGIYITSHVRVIDNAHPVIGIILFILLFFQPILGVAHHVLFKKHSRRQVWSYGHIWLGRIIITLGIINGGLGLQLAKRLGVFAPSRGAIIAYSVIAAIVWLAYVVAAVIGEIRRARTPKAGMMPAQEAPIQPVPSPNGVNEKQGERYA